MAQNPSKSAPVSPGLFFPQKISSKKDVCISVVIGIGWVFLFHKFCGTNSDVWGHFSDWRVCIQYYAFYIYIYGFAKAFDHSHLQIRTWSRTGCGCTWQVFGREIESSKKQRNKCGAIHTPKQEFKVIWNDMDMDCTIMVGVFLLASCSLRLNLFIYSLKVLVPALVSGTLNFTHQVKTERYLWLLKMEDQKHKY